MDDKKLLFIYNPRAGKGQIRNNLLDIIDTFVKAGYVVTALSMQGKPWSLRQTERQNMTSWYAAAEMAHWMRW